MSKQKLIEINPYNKEMMEKVIKYDEKNSTNYLSSLKSTIELVGSALEYEVYKMTMPVIYDVFAYYDGNDLSNLCLTYQQKDLKIFTMYLDNKNFQLYDDLELYATKNLCMSVVAALVDKNNHKLINNLIKDKYTPYFDDNSKEELVPLVKDNTEITKNIR